MSKLALILVLVTSSAFAQIHIPHEKVCAVAFTSVNPHPYSSELHIADGTIIPFLNHLQASHGGNWDNRISKVAVASGCTFIGYQFQNFNIDYHHGNELNGFTLVLSNDTGLPHKMSILDFENDKISSLKCFCSK